jgi:hypothetical protein
MMLFGARNYRDLRGRVCEGGTRTVARLMPRRERARVGAGVQVLARYVLRQDFVGDHHAVAAAQRSDQQSRRADQLFFTAHCRATIPGDAGGGYRGMKPKIAASLARGKTSALLAIREHCARKLPRCRSAGRPVEVACSPPGSGSLILV